MEASPQRLVQVATVNAQFLVNKGRIPALRKTLTESFCVFDGQIPTSIARCLNPKVPISKYSGSRILPRLLCGSLFENPRVFLLGAEPDANRRAVDEIRQQFSVECSGYAPPLLPYPIPQDHDALMLGFIRDFAPNVLLVGFGNPKQELWIAEHRDELSSFGVRAAVGVGGTIDMLAHRFRVAPSAVSRLGLESVFRFLEEPSAMRLRRILYSLRLWDYWR